MKNEFVIFKILKSVLLALALLAFTFVMVFITGTSEFFFSKKDNVEIAKDTVIYQKPLWQAMSMDALVHEKDPELIKYGKELIANTSVYLGPKGKVRAMSNGMNCQNCHLDAGTRPWGNNYGAVLSTYPKFRGRSGSVENIQKRINDCFERSLNGQALDTNSREMLAIKSYIEFIGQFVPKDSIPAGTGITKVKNLKRAADPVRGQLAYEQKCVSCHGQNGEGVMNAEGNAYTYPPLWGPHSYNSGAGLYRLSRFAGYIKSNMPFGATYDKPQLSDEESWDIAAYVNSRPRPSKDLSKDWPKISAKPVDHPFGPYDDGFSEEQHKFGPFKPIEDFKKAKNKK
ncbi:c-type cytochrome [Lacihabitans soyangensis]|uniref:Cytochrome C n=1 Tax=Lacihabitans soyangensis TaxID=869394 RepID=A0AAE3H2C2_9BACT|nr:c-type cytochrome [Lacihabitans soyangensis]MCP9762676.1 cytochrome C [Lacihabitans soyangensis]